MQAVRAHARTQAELIAKAERDNRTLKSAVRSMYRPSAVSQHLSWLVAHDTRFNGLHLTSLCGMCCIAIVILMAVCSIMHRLTGQIISS